MKKTRLATILSLLLVCVCSLAAFTLTACDGGVKVSFSQTEINVTEGLKTTLVITVEGSEEKPSVESSDTSVATVALIGKMCSVTAVKEGTATVTASKGNLHRSRGQGRYRKGYRNSRRSGNNNPFA